MPSYLVETYVPRAGEDVRATGRRVGVAADELRLAGSPIHYVRMTFVPDDETCFHLVEAPSASVVEELCRLAGLGRARVDSAVEDQSQA